VIPGPGSLCLSSNTGGTFKVTSTAVEMAGKQIAGEMSWWHFRPPVKHDIKMSRGTHLMPALWRESINFLRACDTAPVPA
jgi:hypothetical protein